MNFAFHLSKPLRIKGRRKYASGARLKQPGDPRAVLFGSIKTFPGRKIAYNGCQATPDRSLKDFESPDCHRKLQEPTGMSSTAAPKLSPERIFATLTAYQQTYALKAAVELDLFTAIG